MNCHILGLFYAGYNPFLPEDLQQLFVFVSIRVISGKDLDDL
jgi:hypothetical protein